MQSSLEPQPHKRGMEDVSTSEVAPAATVEEVIPAKCWQIRRALSIPEQLEILRDALERSAAQKGNNQRSRCMNPSPKTLLLNGTTPTLRFGPEPLPLASVYDRLILRKANSLLTKHEPPGKSFRYDTYAVGTIRYQAPNGSFPEHVDHCNNGGWVVLLSLGCTATFTIREGTIKSVSKRKLALESGDVVVFDPSTEAAVKHGVESILPESCPTGLVDAFGEEVVANFRYGIQCRTHICSGEDLA